MKRTLLTLVAAGATALGGFLVMQRELNERAKPRRIMKETFWSKLRELWAIRRRCQQIKLQQQKDRLPRSSSGNIGRDIRLIFHLNRARRL